MVKFNMVQMVKSLTNGQINDWFKWSNNESRPNLQARYTNVSKTYTNVSTAYTNVKVKHNHILPGYTIVINKYT